MANLVVDVKTVKELVFTTRHAAMATVNEDGSPHNTPYFFNYDEKLKHLYWGSHVESQHSQNISRTGELFVVVYDSAKFRGGLYIKAENGHIAQGEELDEALAVHNKFRAKEGKAPLEKSYYIDTPQRMWKADVTKLWVLADERNEKGLLIRESRQEITAQELLA